MLHTVSVVSLRVNTNCLFGVPRLQHSWYHVCKDEILEAMSRTLSVRVDASGASHLENLADATVSEKRLVENTALGTLRLQISLRSLQFSKPLLSRVLVNS